MEEKNKTESMTSKEKSPEYSISGGPGDIPIENVADPSEELEGTPNSTIKEGSEDHD